MTLADHRLYFKELPFVHPTSVITVSLGLLTLGIVSSTHGQLVTLLPSVPLSPASCGPLALWLIAAHFDKLLLLWHHKGTSPGAHSNPFICIQVVLYSPTEKHASASQISMCLDLARERGRGGELILVVSHTETLAAETTRICNTFLLGPLWKTATEAELFQTCCT